MCLCGQVTHRSGGDKLGKLAIAMRGNRQIRSKSALWQVFPWGMDQRCQGVCEIECSKLLGSLGHFNARETTCERFTQQRHATPR